MHIGIRCLQQCRQRHLGASGDSGLPQPGFDEVDEERTRWAVVGIAESIAQVGRRGDSPGSFFVGRNVVVLAIASRLCHSRHVKCPRAFVVEGELGDAEVVVGDPVSRLQTTPDEQLWGFLFGGAEVARPGAADFGCEVPPVVGQSRRLLT